MFLATSPTAILSLLTGGMLLLLYGVRLTTEAMQRVAGARLRRAIMLVDDRPLAGLGIGVLATALTQSSGATSALVVGLASSRLVSLPGAITVLLGANIGTTLVVQLLALHLTDHAMTLASLGAAAALATRRTSLCELGQGVFGFGLMVLGLAALMAASTPIATSPMTAAIFQTLASAPLVLALIGAILAVVLAGSAPVIGLVLVLAAGGGLPLLAALALTIGANVGSTGMALLTSLSMRTVAGRRVAAIHSGIKLVGAAVVMVALGPIALLLKYLHPDPAAQVALAHLGFNLVLAAVFTPLARPLARLVSGLLSEDGLAVVTRSRHLDPEALPMPAVALGQATREVLRMADLSTDMLRLSIHAFEQQGADVPARIDALDDQLDDLEAAIKGYLTQLDEDRLSAEQARRVIALLYIITDLEAIGDIIDKQLMRLARRMRRGQMMFSEEGWNDLLSYHGEVTAALEHVLAALAAQDVTIADETLARKAWLTRMKRELHLRHLRRLRSGTRPSLESSAIHLDLLNSMSRVLSHTSNIAHAVRGEL